MSGQRVAAERYTLELKKVAREERKRLILESVDKNLGLEDKW